MASVTPMFSILRRAAPRLTRSFFKCHHACRPSPAHHSSKRLFGSTSVRSSDGILSKPGIVSSFPQRIGSTQASLKNRTRYFPDTSDKSVAYWLLGSAASVFGIVVFGGLTRLTESGFVASLERTSPVLTIFRLSITEWRPVTGSLPPRDAADWDAEFAKYRSSPEFKLLNPHMTLDEFKSIYYMEWTHRIWGRLVGMSFLLPAAYFIARRKVSAPMAGRIIGIAGLIGFQGFLGWWMVKSGLKDDLFAPGSHPRVSQYRLTAHLGTAFLCYTAMLWNGLATLREHKLLADPQQASKLFERLKSPELRLFRRSVGALGVLVFCTALSGGLVAGLDAGLIYNEFPYMGLGLTPPKSELFSDFYSHTPDKSDIWWRNPLENPSLVQLDHRILATTTFTSVMGLWAYTKLSPTLRKMLPAACKKGMHGVVGFVCLQVALGISTLLYLVPLPLASAHQAGALALLSSVVILGGRTWVPRRAASLVSQRLVQSRPVLAKRGT
ncbi:MAG: hypothetical protein L6R39_005031 [Caloplaca ligustica]|nr:MAG: hypothetical protein L6R39_005031 [Caloplaca ligustica]